MSFHFPPATFDFVSLTNNLNKFFIFIFMCFPVVVAAYYKTWIFDISFYLFIFNEKIQTYNYHGF